MPEFPLPKPLQPILLVVILLLAAFLRFHRLETQSFWNDEGNSARLSERPIPAIIEGTASDIHPPLYYLLLHGWRGLAGDSEFALRAFSALAGIGTVAVTMGLARSNGKWGLWAAGLLTAVNPALIYYSQETRMYALLAFEAVLGTWLLWQMEKRPFRLVWKISYILCMAAGLYTHYFFPAVVAAHAVVVIYQSFEFRSSLFALRSSLPSPHVSRFTFHALRLVSWLALTLASLLLYAPWIPIFIRQAGGREGVREGLGQFLVESCRFLAFGATAEATWALVAVAGLLVMGVGWKTAVFAITTLVPVLFMYAAGTTQPEFYKFMLVAVPPFCVWLAGGVAPQRTRRGAKWLVMGWVLLLGVVLWGVGGSLQNLYGNPAYARADYRSMAARIAAENHPNAGIILNAPNQWEVFTYYHRQGAPVYPIPKGQPDPQTIEAELSQIAAQHDRLYAIFWGEAQRDPQRLVERWLDAHAFKATDEWVGDVRFVMYAVAQEGATEMETAVSLPFGDFITLEGYTLRQSQLTAGDVVQMTLFWKTAESLPTRYKVFLHLVDANGQLISQRDSEPGGGLNLTTLWQPGETVVDNHGLLIPVGTAPGEYTLLLGLYDLADPAARLSIQSPSGLVDALPLAVVHIGK